MIDCIQKQRCFARIKMKSRDIKFLYSIVESYYLQMEDQSNKKTKNRKNTPKTDLLKYQKPIFQLKRNEQGKVASLIAKLMIQQKQKPQIGFIPRSNLLSQLDDFLPKLKQSNQQLEKVEIKEQQRIDAKLQQIQDSSSSDSQDEKNQMEDESIKMQEQKPEAKVVQSSSQFQFNILTYPYLQSKQTKDQNTKEVVVKKKIVEIEQVQQKNHLDELQ